MPTPEETNSAMAIIARLQQAYTDGGVGLPPGGDWVDSAFAYLEHGAIYDDYDAARAHLEGYGILVEAPPPPPPPPTLREALDLPEWWDGFRAFAETEFSTENPDFLTAVYTQSMATRDIYDTFVKATAERQVNIPGAMRVPIDEAFAAGDPGHDVFDAAFTEILRMASSDSWRRYLATQQ